MHRKENNFTLIADQGVIANSHLFLLNSDDHDDGYNNDDDDDNDSASIPPDY